MNSIMYRCCILSLAVTLFTSCNFSAGTLGEFPTRTFPTSKRMLTKAIDSLYKLHPEYKIPGKWKEHDDWSSSGYDFLDSRIFYFKASPEEMYYITFIGDGNDSVNVNTIQTSIAIRAVFDGHIRWKKTSDYSPHEQVRIQSRFDEIVLHPLERITNTIAIKEKN